ncbi:hypothetical protein C4J81_02735 [Deltaproteobacteria bacterium Smac51]|nr:hypothetical protein C4J81_02735 [Deltaproteobacteria bacterium Smac51]
MMRLPISVFCLLAISAGPLWAAGEANEAHVFEFDYDHQIEAPVLSPPPETPSIIPMGPEASVVIPPPPVIEPEPEFTPPPPIEPIVVPPVPAPPAATEKPPLAATSKEEVVEGVITIIGEPDPPAPEPPVKTEDDAPGLDSLFAPAEPEPEEKTAAKPYSTDTNMERPAAPAPEPVAAEKPVKEVVVVVKDEEKAAAQSAPPTPPDKPAAKTGKAKTKAGRTAGTAAAKADPALGKDHRYRFWLLASRTWNLSMSKANYYRGTQSISNRVELYPIDQVKFPTVGRVAIYTPPAGAVPAVPAQPVYSGTGRNSAGAQVIDIRYFPRQK